MPRKGENIYKRKDGRWEGRYIKYRNSNGKVHYGYVYAKCYRDVKNKLREQKNSTEIFHKSSICNNSKEIVLEDIINDWMLYVQPRIKESSFVKYQNLLNTYIVPELGKVTIDLITADRLEIFLESLLESGGKKSQGLSRKTVSDVLTVLRSILKFSQKRGFVPVCSGKEIVIKQEQEKIRVLSKTDEKVLLKYLYTNLNNKNLGVILCLFTGIRIGEVCALTWEDISFEDKILCINKTMQRIQNKTFSEKQPSKTKIIISKPKSTCSNRIIPLTREMLELINNKKIIKDGYFLTGEKEKFVEPRTMENHLKRILKECNIEYVNFHVLRHTFATRCIEAGCDIKCLSELLGHANISITMNRYVHPSVELKRKNMQCLSDLFSV